jgi:hypothetical protein
MLPTCFDQTCDHPQWVHYTGYITKHFNPIHKHKILSIKKYDLSIYKNKNAKIFAINSM